MHGRRSVVYPEPERALFFSTSKRGDSATGVSLDGPISHGILKPNCCVFFSPKPHVGHYGESPKARHGHDPSRGESSPSTGAAPVSLSFAGHSRAGNIV